MLVLVTALAAGCAGGEHGNGGSFGPGFVEDDGAAQDTNWWTDGFEPTTTGDGKNDDTTAGTLPSTEGEGEGDEDPGLPPDLGTCSGNETCVIEDTTCFAVQGQCVAGMCVFDAKMAGAPCDDGDACTEGDTCDGFGTCGGSEVMCAVDNGAGSCVDGTCEDLACDGGYADCNGDFMDGCEAQLGTQGHCEGCYDDCAAGPHASGSCAGGSCDFSCDAGWGNCDGDWDNGCEIPLGANQCDVNGLNPDGCWTSHCGSSNNPDAVNFGSWYCFECTTCNMPSANSCRWCSHSTGNWFPAESGCFCGGFEDVSCSP